MLALVGRCRVDKRDFISIYLRDLGTNNAPSCSTSHEVLRQSRPSSIVSRPRSSVGMRVKFFLYSAEARHARCHSVQRRVEADQSVYLFALQLSMAVAASCCRDPWANAQRLWMFGDAV